MFEHKVLFWFLQLDYQIVLAQKLVLLSVSLKVKVDKQLIRRIKDNMTRVKTVKKKDLQSNRTAEVIKDHIISKFSIATSYGIKDNN